MQRLYGLLRKHQVWENYPAGQLNCYENRNQNCQCVLSKPLASKFVSAFTMLSHLHNIHKHIIKSDILMTYSCSKANKVTCSYFTYLKASVCFSQSACQKVEHYLNPPPPTLFVSRKNCSGVCSCKKNFVHSDKPQLEERLFESVYHT